MAVAIQSGLDEIITIADTLLASEAFGKDERSFLDVINQNANKLNRQNVPQMNLIALSTKSVDLRQQITSIVGYSALLNSPKLANHADLAAEQLEKVHRLHDQSRYLHWWLDSLILLANGTVRSEPPTALDSGMLNIRGYLLAQADHYLCRQQLDEVNIPEEIPLVHANDVRTKLMLRGLFAAAMEMREDPQLQLSAYTMMKVVRVRLLILDAMNEQATVAPHLEEQAKATTSFPGKRPTLAHIDTVQSISLVELGLKVASAMARRQGGRLKSRADGDHLLFTLTMPTSPEHALVDAGDE